MQKESRIYIAGHTGLVGSSIVNNLLKRGYKNLILRNHSELDLMNQNDVIGFFSKEKPEYVILAAAKVGGIVANNTYRADFIYQNLMIQNNVIHQSYLFGVKKLLFLGSSCIYPKNVSQPIKEDSLLTSELESTNESYAVAKIAGIKMCESYNFQYGTNFISVMPSNLYGPNDNFNLETSHVLPALIRKIHLGKLLDNDNWDGIREDLNKNPIESINGSSLQKDINGILMRYGVMKGVVNIWGSGNPKREFLWSEDMADACIFLLEYSGMFIKSKVQKSEIRNMHINIGTGVDISIKELAFKIKTCIGYEGDFNFDTSKPDGTKKKVLDVSKIHKLGWQHQINLDKGVKKIYDWYLSE